MYCWDTADDSFEEITEDFESIFLITSNMRKRIFLSIKIATHYEFSRCKTTAAKQCGSGGHIFILL